jgi:hypothetical protein
MPEKLIENSHYCDSSSDWAGASEGRGSSLNRKRYALQLKVEVGWSFLELAANYRLVPGAAYYIYAAKGLTRMSTYHSR